MATIRDVAKLAGVSISTVSLTFNQVGSVSQATQARVWDAADEVRYKPNPLAQSLKRGHTSLVGMIIPDVGDPFFSGLVKEAERHALQKDHMLIVSNSNGSPARELDILDHLSAQRVAGIILTGHGHTASYARKVMDFEIPIVMLDQRVDGLDTDFVATDNVLASAMVAEHLIRFGHTRIAHISGTKGLWTADQRLKGFRDTMVASNVPVVERLIIDCDYDGDKAYSGVRRLLTGPNPPTAISAASSSMALGSLKAINDLGLSCPDDISLAAIDGVPWNHLIQPRITMVEQQIKSIAQKTLNYLMDRIDGRDGASLPAREHMLIPKLVVGQSCAPPPV